MPLDGVRASSLVIEPVQVGHLPMASSSAPFFGLGKDSWDYTTV
jgi:hypothetical protein